MTPRSARCLQRHANSSEAASDTSEHFCIKELGLGIGIVMFHQPCCVRSNGLIHFGGVIGESALLRTLLMLLLLHL